MFKSMLVSSVRKGVLIVVIGLLGYHVCGLAQSANVVKWTQEPNPNGWDVNITGQTLASDFLCNQTGPITDAHLWTSFYNDDPGNFNFTLSIWRDIPEGPNFEYSRPGVMLAQWTGLVPSGITFIPEAGNQGWYDPVTQPPYPNNHVNMWKYDFLIPKGSEFVQTEGNIYWLGVEANPVDPFERAMIGWKTALEVRYDDATYSVPQAGWFELMDPTPGHSGSMDLAFEITTPAPSVPDGGASALLLGLGLLGLWGAKRFSR